MTEKLLIKVSKFPLWSFILPSSQTGNKYMTDQHWSLDSTFWVLHWGTQSAAGTFPPITSSQQVQALFSGLMRLKWDPIYITTLLMLENSCHVSQRHHETSPVSPITFPKMEYLALGLLISMDSSSSLDILLKQHQELNTELHMWKSAYYLQSPDHFLPTTFSLETTLCLGSMKTNLTISFISCKCESP